MPDITGHGWELRIQRLREERRVNRNRTVGTYQLFLDGAEAFGIAGLTCECAGPGDNSRPNGKRIAAGTYAVATQDGGKYKTIGYQRGPDKRRKPRPGIELTGTGGRSEIILHPGSGFLSSIGCINPSGPLADAASDIDFSVSYAKVVELIETLKGYLGNQFPARDGMAIPQATVCILGEPALDRAEFFNTMRVFTGANTGSDSTISAAQFAQLCPRPGSGNKQTIYDSYIDAFISDRGRAALQRYGVSDNRARMAHFFGQAAQETGGFTLFRESLFYTTVGAIRSAWSARASHHTDAWITANLLRQPVALGDWAYGGRMGNRAGTSDGFDFRGGGVFQTTGKESFRQKGAAAGVDLVAHPELIDDPNISLITACAEWKQLNCNALADAGQVRKISRGINRGDVNSSTAANGEADRIQMTTRLIAILG